MTIFYNLFEGGGGGSNPQNHKESSSNTTNEGVTRRFKFTETYVFSQKVTFNFCKIEKKKQKFSRTDFKYFDIYRDEKYILV